MCPLAHGGNASERDPIPGSFFESALNLRSFHCDTLLGKIAVWLVGLTMRARIDEQLRRARAGGAGALLPYLTVGYPSLDVTQDLILRCDQLGVAVIELGLPFSDSIADGPTIQSSFHQALANRFRVRDVFDLVRAVRDRVQCALVAMTSFTLVHRMGLEKFLDRAAEVDVDGVILPDLPIEESEEARRAADTRELAMIGLIAPATTAERRRRIVSASTGFVYQMAVAGTTGERAALPPSLEADVRDLRSMSDLPVCVGFGVSTAAHVRAICRIADGAIVGSAIVRRMNEALRAGRDRQTIVEEVSAFVAELIEATKTHP